MTWAKMCKGDPYSFNETLLFSGFSFLQCKKKGGVCGQYDDVCSQVQSYVILLVILVTCHWLDPGLSDTLGRTQVPRRRWHGYWP